MIRNFMYLWVLAIVAWSCSKSQELLIITGGHAYDTTEFYELFNSLEGISFDSVSYPYARNLLSSPEIGKYDVLLFYDYVPDMPLADSAIFQDLTQMGMPMIFMHHALCTFQRWEGYKQIVGGRYFMPGYNHDSSLYSGYEHDLDLKIEVLDPSHPVTRGISEFVIHDEAYFNIQFNPEANPLLGTNHPQGAPVMAWENQGQNSTCLYLMFGHDKQAYANEHFKLLLKNSIQYLSNP